MKLKNLLISVETWDEVEKMKAKCVKGGCGCEFENTNSETFFDTIDEENILFEIENETGYVRGYVFCPICGSRCVGV